MSFCLNCHCQPWKCKDLQRKPYHCAWLGCVLLKPTVFTTVRSPVSLPALLAVLKRCMLNALHNCLLAACNLFGYSCHSNTKQPMPATNIFHNLSFQHARRLRYTWLAEFCREQDRASGSSPHWGASLTTAGAAPCRS